MIVEYEHVIRLLEDMGLTTASQILDAKLEEAVQNENISYLVLASCIVCCLRKKEPAKYGVKIPG